MAASTASLFTSLGFIGPKPISAQAAFTRSRYGTSEGACVGVLIASKENSWNPAYETTSGGYSTPLLYCSAAWMLLTLEYSKLLIQGALLELGRVPGLAGLKEMGVPSERSASCGGGPLGGGPGGGRGGMMPPGPGMPPIAAMAMNSGGIMGAPGIIIPGRGNGMSKPGPSCTV